MKEEARKFIDCLQDAGQLLEDYPSVSHAGIDRALSYDTPEHFNLALFEKWSEFFEPEFPRKPPVRIIQHLSCTGGTIMSKCLAGLPNVVLLSEANPSSELHVESTPPGFAPSDIIYLAKRAKIPQFKQLCRNIFKADIGVIARHSRLLGKHLVIREHSHSDFLIGEAPKKFSTIREFLKEDHPIRSVLTVRHPVDSYLSMVDRNWIHFTPGTIEEYCRRYMVFIDRNKDVPFYKYEHFVKDPVAEIDRMCDTLDLPFNEDFMDIFDLNALSGDSGRSSPIIEKRERRSFDQDFQKHLEDCRSYQELCEKLEYEASLDAPVPSGDKNT